MKKDGLVNRIVISPLIGLVVILSLCFLVLHGPKTAALAKVTITAVGFALGVVLGGLPNLFDNVQVGQSAMDGTPAAKAPAKTTPTSTKP